MKTLISIAFLLAATACQAQFGTIGTGFGKDLETAISQSTAASATSLAANGTNCGAGQAAQGIDINGNSEGCYATATDISGKVNKAGDTVTGLMEISGSSLTVKATDAPSQATVFDSQAQIALVRDTPFVAGSTDTLRFGYQFGNIYGESGSQSAWVNNVASNGTSPAAFIRGAMWGNTIANPTATLGGQGVQFDFRGHGGSVFTGSRARVTLAAESNWGATDHPTIISFFTTPDGSQTIAERARFTSSGSFGIGITAPAEKLDVVGNIKASGTVAAGAGSNTVYHCVGSTAGTFDGNLARGNANAGACAGGTWTATSLRVD